MNSLAALVAPLALILPQAWDVLREEEPEVARAAERSEGKLPPLGVQVPLPEPFRVLEQARQPPVLRQVRVEQRVIIRIAPSRRGTHDQLVPAARPFAQLTEEKLDGCVPIDAISAVQPTRENRLLLFMRDRRVLSASLDRSCNAADFYSGFYIERNNDGALCRRRDRLQSRAGASCEVTQLSRIVATREGD